MAKLRIVLKKSCRKQEKHNPWASIFTDCPPESPYQLYLNAALDAMGEKHGDAINELSEGVAELLIDIAQTAAIAALEAAKVGNDWREVIKSPKKDAIKPKPRSTREECDSCQPRSTDKYRPLWEEQGPGSSTELYRFMAWQAQDQKFPHFMCDECGSFDDEQIGEILKVVDYMLDFALTAAGVANDWTKLFEAAKAKMDSKK